MGDLRRRAARVPTRASLRLPAAVLLAAVLVVTGCGDDDAVDTTESTVSADSTTTAATTTTEGRLEFQPNGAPFVRQGDRSAWVEALQWYLLCSGFDRISEDDDTIEIDGVFGPRTGQSVAYAQATYRRIPTGEPDEETFAMLARDCADPRTFEIPAGGGEVQAAGNAAPGDDDVIRFDGGAGRVVEVVVMDGNVSVTLEAPTSGVLKTVTPGGGWSERLPETGTYTLRATADDSQSYLVRLRVGG